MQRNARPPSGQNAHATVFIVEDDQDLRGGMRLVLERDFSAIADFPSAEAFLDAYRPTEIACLLLDAFMPGMDGLALLEHVQRLSHDLPVVIITGHGCVPSAVEAMRQGAFDFVEKPIGNNELITTVGRALAESGRMRAARLQHGSVVSDLASLTNRQAQILSRILAGVANRMIAAELGISQRTVENHRAAIMEKTGARSLPELTRMAVAARWSGLEIAALMKG
ncbi:MAG: response regulator transcription factor [Clostridia bacterium]|nr:response regulator transcription factor [Deltaproteobacteria bacterium]